ncbi:unnamed protein product (macronuclear) [Paramecium tetraurelia]|uniref:Ras-related protein Rab-21 n=1 Tax=Paramecium tetraurelia TaxID=5888 RepID=Q3SDV6_PARTE|nr:uncharacterized protein GSPATT00037464001 [Paramecium tetraurelia]CAI39252.1 rab_B76 [Paramecium tetraurelia]CAK68679.1 unnamed protein product [Paramecium tetraurelia]|eukprot:XP_001436076.1 hypothetical protein (macronuclear) [Paramecium tetraurelia strain d4-2]
MKKQKFEDRVYKVVTLGEGRVGKTSIITRFFDNSFSEQTQETSDGYCKEKTIQTKKGPIDLAVWDTAGQEKYHSLAPLYYRNSDAAIIVYDITVKETLQKGRQWIQELKQMAENDNMLLVIVGNKCDMHIQKDVEQSQIDELCNQYNAKHFLVSAKSGKGIPEIFDHLANELKQIVKQTNTRNTLKQGKKKESQNQGGSCC